LNECINRISFDFTNFKFGDFSQPFLSDDIDLFEKDFIGKFTTSCKQKLGYPLFLSSKERTRKLRGPASVLLLRYWNGQHWSFLSLIFWAAVHSLQLYHQILCRSNWKGNLVWSGRKKKPPDKLVQAWCTTGKRKYNMRSQLNPTFGKFDERKGRWKSKRKNTNMVRP
jgi:hypothetical protein